MPDSTISALTQLTPSLEDETALVDTSGAVSRMTTMGQMAVLFGLSYQRATLAGNARMVLEGAAHWIVTDLTEQTENIVGVPRIASTAYVVPDGFVLNVPNQLAIRGAGRISVRGSGTLIVDDNVTSRQRLVLAG